MITPEELDKMSLTELVKQYAKDVMETENNPEYLRMSFQICGGPLDGEHEAKYPAGNGEFIYDFLLGSGSLGYPFRPTKIGEAVYKVAEIVGTQVMFMDFTYAKFNKRITPKAIEEAFYPIWEESERMKAQERGK